MSDERLRGDALCRAIMWDMHRTTGGISRRMAGYLRHGVKCGGDEYSARNISKLASANLTHEQIDALEETLRQVQEELIDVFLGIIDRGRQPQGFPDQIRLVDMDTGEPICPEFLAATFSMVGLDYYEQRRRGGTGATGGE